MSRYIDAEPLEKRSPKLRALILEQPTADVVEVVRCDQCIHKTLCSQTMEINGKMYHVDHCSYGERKE